MRLHTYSSLLFALLLLVLTACGAPQARIPDTSRSVDEALQVYPDYRNIVIPPNIAPLNMQVKNAGDSFVVTYEGHKGRLIAAAGKDGKFVLDSLAWHDLLAANADQDLTVTLYARRAGGWVRFRPYVIHVAPDPIDRYLSYRLIEPSYELYRQLGLYQRDLTGYDVRIIYENNRRFDLPNNHCVNCHNYQNYSTRRMLFHVRANHGGTVFITDGKAEKVNLKSDSILSSAVYPAWHPTEPWLVFSSNLTGQAFHIINPERVEVMDYGSDLIFYDVARKRVVNVLKTDTDLETFPTWAPDGRTLYYCVAHVPEFAGMTPDERTNRVMGLYRRLHYNIMSMSFDPATRRFGTPRLEVDCATSGHSASVPRVSPDGRYLLFTQGDYGQFHIWHKSSDLYVKDLTTGRVYPLAAANAKNAPDSYHGWSSNGRWIVLASRRDDGSYSRVYIAYFDRQGQAHKAFILPQRDPEQNILLPKSYNVPELTRDAVPLTFDKLKEVVYDDAHAAAVTYGR